MSHSYTALKPITKEEPDDDDEAFELQSRSNDLENNNKELRLDVEANRSSSRHQQRHVRSSSTSSFIHFKAPIQPDTSRDSIDASSTSHIYNGNSEDNSICASNEIQGGLRLASQVSFVKGGNKGIREKSKIEDNRSNLKKIPGTPIVINVCSRFSSCRLDDGYISGTTIKNDG